MNKIVIDSSVFVSVLGKPDNFTISSRKLFNGLSKDIQVVVPSLVLAETVVNLGKQDVKIAHEAFNLLSRMGLVALDEVVVKELLSFIKKPLGLKTSDAIIAITAFRIKANLVTWDRQLLSKKNTICEAVSPADYIAGLKN